MNDSVSQASLTPVARIGIRGLPNLVDSMLNGGVYVLIAQTPSARFPLLAASLASAIMDGMACNVVVPAEPALFIQRIESYGDLAVRELIDANRLQFFVMQDEFSKKMFRSGAEGFVEELEHFAIPENSYLLFNHADELLSLHDLSLALDQADVLRKWAAQKRVTMLLVFSRATDTQAGTLNALMDSLTGIARLGVDKDGLELAFDYWQSTEGTIAARNFRLATLGSGLYEASTKLATAEQAMEGEPVAREEEAEDAETHFFYMDPDLGSLAKQMPGIWRRVDTLVGLMHATRNTRSATSILSFQRDTNLRQLAEAIHTLRLSLGRRARIVVQEKGASLRYQNEALLLRLGLNLVVNRDVPISRLPLLLDSLKGQIFSRDVDINFEAALASVLPTRLRGYLAPLSFVREVDSILDQAQTLNIPCAMIIGKPGAGMTITEALSISGLSRPGDLISTDGAYCYLFLNACPQSVMLTTLERILGMPVDAAFDDIRFLILREEIQAELPVLARTVKQAVLPDYASLIPASPPLPQILDENTPNEAQRLTQALTTTPSGQVPPVIVVLNERAFKDRHAPSVKPTRNSTPFVQQSANQLAVLPGADVVTLDAPTDGSLYRYDNNVARPSFGRKSAPRATRSSLPNDSADALGEGDAKRAP
jgi:cellulose biosynthesis protein BcsE